MKRACLALALLAAVLAADAFRVPAHPLSSRALAEREPRLSGKMARDSSGVSESLFGSVVTIDPVVAAAVRRDARRRLDMIREVAAVVASPHATREASDDPFDLGTQLDSFLSRGNLNGQCLLTIVRNRNALQNTCLPVLSTTLANATTSQLGAYCTADCADKVKDFINNCLAPELRNQEFSGDVEDALERILRTLIRKLYGAIAELPCVTDGPSSYCKIDFDGYLDDMDTAGSVITDDTASLSSKRGALDDICNVCYRKVNRRLGNVLTAFSKELDRAFRGGDEDDGDMDEGEGEFGGTAIATNSADDGSFNPDRIIHTSILTVVYELACSRDEDDYCLLEYESFDNTYPQCKIDGLLDGYVYESEVEFDATLACMTALCTDLRTCARKTYATLAQLVDGDNPVQLAINAANLEMLCARKSESGPFCITLTDTVDSIISTNGPNCDGDKELFNDRCVGDCVDVYPALAEHLGCCYGILIKLGEALSGPRWATYRSADCTENNFVAACNVSRSTTFASGQLTINIDASVNEAELLQGIIRDLAATFGVPITWIEATFSSSRRREARTVDFKVYGSDDSEVAALQTEVTTALEEGTVSTSATSSIVTKAQSAETPGPPGGSGAAAHGPAGGIFLAALLAAAVVALLG